jgi:ADP-dependent NAD(P)H-hydrate dehydratase / NAD(P)H-hydrate epimerase
MEKIIYQDKLLYPEILWERPVHYYKAQGGKVFLLAGSKGMSGAAILASEAVFRSGTGILTLGFPEAIKDVYKELLPEAMTLPLPSTPSGSVAKNAYDEILEQVKSCDVCIIGPGLSTNAETTQLIWELLFEIEKPIVLDADGLTAFAKGIEVLRSKESVEYLKDYMGKKKGRLIITPHPGEAEKIIKAIKDESVFGKKHDSNYIELHKKEIAPKLAEILGTTVVLKGHDTTIATEEGNLVINRVGGPELATAGSGDVLSGVIGSFVAQNPDKIFESICTAVYLHGKAGEITKEKIGERSVTASDLIRCLPEAIKSLEE